MSEAPCLYTVVLDAGDRLVSALRTGDFGGAARVLGERRELIASLRHANLPPPARPIVERFQEQDARLSAVLGQQIASLQDKVSTTGRAAIAQGRYTSMSEYSPILDTAPRP